MMGKSDLVAGADEAGRGPVLGSMIICGVSLKPNVFKELNMERVRDSKLISPKRRAELAELIIDRAEKFEVIEFEAGEIDRLRLSEGVNLNEIEAMGFAEVINRLNPSKMYVDSASSNSEKFAESIKGRLKVNTDLIVEHGADNKYLPVSAASIIAKVKRDDIIMELSRKHGELGSGYPSDERTIKFLENWVKENRSLPSFARKSWKTSQRIEKRFI